MSIAVQQASVVADPGQEIEISSLFSVTPGANPEYIVVSGLDRQEYIAASNGSVGTISGNGNTKTFTQFDGDADSFGLIFTYNATTGQYVNSVYGDLSSLVLTTAADVGSNEDISLFASNDSSLLSEYANNPFALSQYAGSSCVGTVAVVTDPALAGSSPTQATPDSIVSVADSFIGEDWNDNGCWLLANEISAEAGASLPLSSTALGVPGQANGEWIVSYNGPAGQPGNWQSMIKAGEMVVFETSLLSGHITTVVSGSGSTAELVDNIAYVNSGGSIINTANDGSLNDIVIAGPHSASQEFRLALSGSVVIYELDTPTITVITPTSSVAAGGTLSLAGLFSATDPANKSITEYQVYDSVASGAAQDQFVIDGSAITATSAADAATVLAGSLSAAALQAGASAQTDALEVRAYNGSYWGDWQSLSVNVTGSLQPVATPAQAISDTATDIQSGLANLATEANDIASITATGGAVVVDISSLNTYAVVLNKIVGGFDISDTASNVESDLSALATDISGFSISDTGTNVQNAVSSLAADAGHIDTITATGGMVTVAVGQISADQAALNEIVGGFVVDVSTNTTFAANSVSNVQGFIVESGVTANLSALTAGEVVTVPGAGASVTVTFAGPNAELVIGNNLANGSIGGEIVGAAVSDSIDFSADIAAYSASNHLSWQQTSASGGILSLVNSSSTTLGSVELAGSYRTSDFSMSADDLSPPDQGTLATIVASLPAAQIPNDFSAEGIWDVFWRNSNGALATWLMNGAAIASSGAPTFGGNAVAPDSSWSVAGTGDFNGDGDADILWRQSSTGSLAEWLMNGSTIQASTTPTFQGQAVSPGSSWSVAGIGDFNGDGDADILWRQSSTGSLGEWLMNGSVIQASTAPTFQGQAVSPDSSWSVAGIGDFNGNGDADILWRQSTTGSLAMWLMNGSAISSSPSVTSAGSSVAPDSTWSVIGVGDFNGDGDADILWRQSTTGSLAMWLMNGSAISSSASVTSGGNAVAPDSTWTIVEVGDFNGSSQAGILWQQNTTGTLVEWQMNGVQIASSQTMTSGGTPIAPASTWQVQANATDFV